MKKQATTLSNSTCLSQQNLVELALLQKQKYEGTDKKELTGNELVIKAIQYMIQKYQTDIKHKYAELYYHKQSKQGKVVGSFIMAFESHKVWWLRSAYVFQQWRSQGIFTSMYQISKKRAYDIGVERIKLYVNRSNSRAFKLYYGFGYHETDQVFYCHSLTDKKYLVRQGLEQPSSISILGHNEENQNLKQFVQILSKHSEHEKRCKYHRWVKILYERDQETDKTMHIRYYLQFSDWNYYLILCISSIRVKQPDYQHILNGKMDIRPILNQLVDFVQNQIAGTGPTLKQLRIIPHRNDSKTWFTQYFNENQFFQEPYNSLELIL